MVFAIPALFSLSPYRAERKLRILILMIFAVLSSLMIGLRYQVGGDWDSYLDYVKMVNGLSLLEAMAINDPAYMALNWFSDQFGLGIYGVNLVCGTLFMLGLVRFCYNQPLPWLALTVATPYLLIVVAMGYSRQGVALGLALWALNELQSNKVSHFTFLILFAALFHKSAIILLPLIQINSAGKGKFRSMLLFFLALVVGAFLIVDTISSQWKNYVEDQMQSDGSALRIWMNVVPAAFLFSFRKKWEKLWPGTIKIWKWIAIAAVLCIPLQSLASTATDRLALYFAPLQLAVYSRLPYMVPKHWQAIVLIGVVFFYCAVLFVWLHFSYHATHFWVPYKWHL